MSCCLIHTISVCPVSSCHICSWVSKHSSSLEGGKLKMMVDFAVSWSLPPCLIILRCMSTNWYQIITQSLTTLAINIQRDKLPGSTADLVHCVVDTLQTYAGSHSKLWFRKERGHQKEHEPYVHCSQLHCNVIQGLQWVIKVDSQSEEILAAVAVHFSPTTC